MNLYLGHLYGQSYNYQHLPTPLTIEATYIDLDQANAIYSSSPNFMPQADKYPENPFFKKPTTPTTVQNAHIGWVIPQDSNRDAQLKELERTMTLYIDNKISSIMLSKNQDNELQELRKELIEHVDNKISQVNSVQNANFANVNTSVGQLSNKIVNLEEEVKRIEEALNADDIATTTKKYRKFEPRFIEE